MNLAHLLRNLPVRSLIQGLERDGFFLYRNARGSSRVYRHPDGRQVVIHYHRGNQTLPIGTLSQVLRGTKWTAEDARRLGLIR